MPWASVFDNVWLPLRLQGLSQRESKSRVFAALKSVGLEDFASSFPSQLSGGMRMRASITRALITDPKILLMDEPFGALDDFTRQKLNDDLLRWQQERAVATLFVTHNIAEAVFLSQRVLVMQARPGKIMHTLRINEPYPRTPAFRTSMTFLNYCRELSVALERAMLTETSAQ
jgi:NitT/TauT family transport system ATP-binding protein